MKKSILFLTYFLYALSLSAQNELFIGKWDIAEVTSDGQTVSLEQLKEFSMGSDNLEILTDGTFTRLDKGDMENGTWEYIKAEKFLKLTFIPSEEAKAQGQGPSTAKFTVKEMSEEKLTLDLGTIMSTTYKRAK